MTMSIAVVRAWDVVVVRAQFFGKRWWAVAALLVVGAMLTFDVVVLVPSSAQTRARAATGPALSVDFGAKVATTSPYALGLGSSTYGASPLTDPAQAKVERALDARSVRVPVGVRNGRITSSATGTTGVDVVALVRMYLTWGYHVLVVIGGQTDDVDVHPGDTTRIVSALGYDNGVQYSTSNEPTAEGESTQDAIAQAKMMLAEGRALHRDFTIWGPVWAYYDRAAMMQFAQALGTGLAGLDYHHYAMGQTSIDTASAMRQTPSFGTEVTTTTADLKAAGLSGRVAVDETNLSWRYNDGTPGGDSRFFTAVNTVWIASACGHVLLAGGTCMPYANQNGALGMTVEQGGPNPAHRPVSSPMPGYWGIAAWTGATVFPHMRDAFYHATSTSADVEVFAVNNEAGGYNLIVINKSSVATTATIGLSRVAPGTYVSYRTVPTSPYHAPVPSVAHRYRSTISVSMPGMSLVTYVLKPTGTG